MASPTPENRDEDQALAATDGAERPQTSRIAAQPGVVMTESEEDRRANQRQLASLKRMTTQRSAFVGNVVGER